MLEIFYVEAVVHILHSVDTTEGKNTIRWSWTENGQGLGSNDYKIA